MRYGAVCAFLSATLLLGQAQPGGQQAEPGWVERSNQNAKVLLDVRARYAPESAASQGTAGLDDKITVLAADTPQRYRQDLLNARAELESRLMRERDPLVRQDLEIMIAAADRDARSIEAAQRLLLPYTNITSLVYYGVKSLLDDQVQPQRRASAIIRLRRYAGMEAGYTPITVQAQRRFSEKAKAAGLLGPPKAQVEKDLENSQTFINEAAMLFAKYQMTGYQEPLAKLKQQIRDYENFVRKRVLPRARTDFRLPPELYTLAMENYGVDYAVDDLTRLAHESFSQIQQEMQPLASKIAQQRGLASSDYRDVIRALKKEQLPGDQILAHYKQRLADIEAIIRREHLITLPARPAIIHLASAAETANQPAPHMMPPRLIDNHGERGQFVLPLGTTGEKGKSLAYDDFTFAAASWTLTAHEARPGHELQFDVMVERGVSHARAIFAFNSTNVEGWGLYAEWFMLPYMPEEGKLVSLQLRLLRAARAFLDPELQQGKITPAQAMAILQNDVVCSEGFATEEVERFTFRMPGQAVSYFDGFTRLKAIRSEAEAALGPKFNVQDFHDFILSQGLLPSRLLRKAVLEEFVARRTGDIRTLAAPAN